jgi:Ca-activated chloride channel family protein
LDNGAVPADRDFVLEWEIEPSAAPRAALFTQVMGEDKYVLLMMMPPEGGPGDVGRLPRETLFIIDTSGSMGGASIRQARKALQVALERLRPEDAFNIIEFNNQAHRLFPNSVAAEAGHLETAKRYVGALRANGGTEMMSALRLALEVSELGERVRQVVFITDGSVGNERRLFDYIREHLGASRLFTVGIGSAPNSHFMRKAAQFGRGTFTYIGNLGEVEEEMTRLFRKLESPVLRNIRLDWACPNVDAWPERVPDLYQGEPVLVAARLTAFGDDLGSVTLSGSRADVPWQRDLNLKGGAPRIGVDKLWARKKIASLVDRLGDGAAEDDVRPAIIELGLRHHLVSKYTSLVAVDVTPTAPVGEFPETKPLPVNLPAGWSAEHLFASMPQGATPAPLYLIVGLVTSAAAWFFRKRKGA